MTVHLSKGLGKAESAVNITVGQSSSHLETGEFGMSVRHDGDSVVEASFGKLETGAFVPAGAETMVLLLLTTVVAFELVRKSEEQFCQKYL